MRKNMLMLLAAALLVVTGCKKDNNTENNNGEKMIFTATIDNGAKTQINGYDQVWNSGDKVSINGGEFTVTPKDGDPSWATFEGQTVEPVEGIYKAIFPSSLYHDNVYELPATQTYNGNNLSEVNPLYAESTTQELVFHNICALLKLNLKGTTGTEKVTKIEVTANEQLSGVFNIVDNKAVFGRNQNAGVLTLNCGDGATLSTGGTAFYIAIPEGSYTGLTFTVTSDGGTWEYKANETGSISVAANKLYESTQTPVFTPAGTYSGLCFTAEEANSTVSMAINGTGWTIPVLETSTDGNDWTTFTPGATTITLANKGDKVYFRRQGEATTTFSSSNSKYAYFVMTGKIAASGNVMSLLDPKCEATTISSDYCFGQLFSGCTSLTAAPELPATTLANSCYYYMFQGCTSLATAPALPAESLTVSCYSGMFKDCSSLTSAPVLNATSLGIACYVGMFNGCTSLATAPVLSAETLVANCYAEMFRGCKALTTAPALPATTLATNCYNGMFNGCSSLTTAPELPAETLAINCYKQMFSACSKLNYIKVYFTAWDSNTTDWVKDVPTGGTFCCPNTLPHEGPDYFTKDRIPTGWTVNPPL